MNARKFLSIAAALASAFGLATAAYAVPTLSLSSGATTVIVADEGVGDQAPGTLGTVIFSGAINQWIVNVTTGIGFPLLPDQPHLDLNSINVSSGPAAGPNGMEIMLSDMGFTQEVGNIAGFEGRIGGTTNGLITWELWINLQNTLFGHDTDPGSVLIGTGNALESAFADSFTNSLLLTGPYSMTLRVFVQHPDGVRNSSFDFEGRMVPEPGTLLLLGVGLVGLGLARRKLS